MGMLGTIRRHGGLAGAAILVRRALRALLELARARARLTTLGPAGIAMLNRQAAEAGRGPLAGGPADARALDMVGSAVPGVAKWLFWRSDCLVQALAAQRWLLALGVASEIVIGVDKSHARGFEPHAWLRHGDRIVTGGEIARYKVLFETGVTGGKS